MAITVIQQPQPVFLAYSEKELIVETDSYWLNQGTNAQLYLIVSSVPANGTKISFEFLGRIEEFTFTNNLATANSLPNYIYAPAVSVNTFITTYLVPKLTSNYYLFRHYEVTSSIGNVNGNVKILARELGTDYTIAGGLGNPSITYKPVGKAVNAQARPNFRIIADLWVEEAPGSNAYKPAYAADAAPINNRASFDFEDVYRGIFGFDIPSFNPGLNFILNAQQKRVQYRISEAYGQPLYVYPAKQLPEFNTLTALAGGSQLRIDENFDQLFVSGTAGTRRFLTNMPNLVPVLKSQKNYLTVFVPGTFGNNISLNATLKLYYDDGTFIEDLVFAFPVQPCGGRFLTIQAGYNELQLDEVKDPAKTIDRYTISISGATHTFLVRDEPELYARTFMFINSFGFPETILFTGARSLSLEMDNDIVRRNSVRINTEKSILEGEFDEVNNTLRQNYELSTGYHTKEYLEWFKDFVMSANRYEVISNCFSKMIIEKSKIKLFDEDDTLFAVKFSYKDAWIERGLA